MTLYDRMTGRTPLSGGVSLPVAAGRRLRPTPDQIPGADFEALVVADVDLDSGTTTTQPNLTAFASPPTGVYGVAWLHGEPIGDVTMTGDPGTIVQSLAQEAQSELRRAVLEHHLRDSLAAPGGLGEPTEDDLLGTPHPRRPTLDATQVTVAVCTRDRPDQLRDCLQAIMGLTARVAEVLVVDNASADEQTRDVAAQFPEVRYVREPRKGLDWARNRALLEARSTFVAFTDDDVLVHPGWIDGALLAFHEEPAAVVVTGLVIPAELATRAQVVFEREGGFGRGYRRRYFASAVNAGEVAAERHAGTGQAGTGANMTVRREALLDLGGFDTALDVGTPTGGGGDLEMFFRVIASGGLVVYEPSAVVRHRHRRTMEELARQRRGDGTGSYSIFVGAGRRYGLVQYRAFIRFALWWAYARHVRGNLKSVLRPSVWPPSSVRPDTLGAFAAVCGRYYSRARAQATEQAALHPDEPTAPDLVHPAARNTVDPRPTPVLRIDLRREGLARSLPEDVCNGDAALVTVELYRRGSLDSRFTMHTGGSGVSPARLRWEVAAHLLARSPRHEIRMLLRRRLRPLVAVARRILGRQ